MKGSSGIGATHARRITSDSRSIPTVPRRRARDAHVDHIRVTWHLSLTSVWLVGWCTLWLVSLPRDGGTSFFSLGLAPRGRIPSVRRVDVPRRFEYLGQRTIREDDVFDEFLSFFQ